MNNCRFCEKPTKEVRFQPTVGEEGKIEMIRNFKQLGLSNEQIATASQFSLEQIEEILSSTP
jgi:hypothetical protein